MKTKTGSTYDFRSADATHNTPRAEDETASEQNEPIGTTKSGYAPPEDGPFECANCEHYSEISDSHGDCDHPDVVADAKAGEIGMSDKEALVEAKGCCNMYRPEEEEL